MYKALKKKDQEFTGKIRFTTRYSPW